MSIKLIENGSIILDGNNEKLKVRISGKFILLIKGSNVNVNIDFIDNDGTTFINSVVPIQFEGVYELADASGLSISISDGSIADDVRIV